MTNYSAIGLNEYLQPIASPVTGIGFVDSYSFDSKYERSSVTNTFLQDASVTNAKIVSLTADKLAAGTITTQIGVGTTSTGYLLMDGANNRFVVNDGTVDRSYYGKF